jgi:hypothetical protein
MSSAASTDFLPDTAYVARTYCPGCEPYADPSLTFSTCAGANPTLRREMVPTTTW